MFEISIYFGKNFLLKTGFLVIFSFAKKLHVFCNFELVPPPKTMSIVNELLFCVFMGLKNRYQCRYL